MKGRVLKDYKHDKNDFNYKKDEVIEVIEITGINYKYAILNDLQIRNVLDWIPRELVEVL